MDKTPDHTVFCKVRKKIGAEKLVLRFSVFSKAQLQAQGYMGEVFNLLLAQNKAVFVTPRTHRMQTGTRRCRLLPRNALPSITI